MPLLKVGDPVMWVKAITGVDRHQQDIIGKVLFVIPSDSGFQEFALYDVQFDFGRFTLYGTQIKAASESGPSDGRAHRQISH